VPVALDVVGRGLAPHQRLSAAYSPLQSQGIPRNRLDFTFSVSFEIRRGSVVGKHAAVDTEATQTDRADTGRLRVAVEIKAPDKRLLPRTGATALRDAHSPKAIDVGLVFR